MKKVLRWSLGSLAVATVLITVMHVPPVSGWLGWNRHGGGPCPFGYSGDAPRTAIKHVRGTGTVARARPALGWELGHTTRTDLLAWGYTHGSLCGVQHGGAELECPNVAISGKQGGGLISTVWFELDSNDTLVSVRTVRRTPRASELAHAFTTTTRAITAEAGAPRVIDAADAKQLARGTLAQVSAEYTFADYRAQIRATNLGDSYALTEQYTALD